MKGSVSSLETIDFSGWRTIKDGSFFVWLLNPVNVGKKTEFPNFAIVFKETQTVEAFANSYLAAGSVFEDSEEVMKRNTGALGEDVPEPPQADGLH